MDISCANTPCPILLRSSCVFYTGDSLIYTGITTNDNLEVALQKIDDKFKDAAIGYIFNNGITQLNPGDAVQLGGNLIQNTTLTSNGFTFKVTDSIESQQFITTGGLNSQFVKGDGSLDSTSYQPTGNYITQLTGDGTASGPGSAVLTLANTGVVANTYGTTSTVPRITVNSKGLLTSVTDVPINIPSSLLIIIGDVQGTGYTGSSTTLTLNTVNSNVYSSLTPLKFTVNGKGLVTSASPITSLDLDGVYGYTPVPNTRTITINGVTQNLAANRSWTISASSVTWGSITGVITNQTDLISYLASNYYPLSSNPAGYLTDAPSDGNTYGRKNGAWTTITVPTSYITSVSNTSTINLDVTAGDLTATLASLTGFTTDDLTEGTTNLYDKTVTLTPGTGIGITGTYPNFTITNTSPSTGGTVTSVSAGTGMSFSTITTTGSVAIDTSKIPYLSGGFSTGLLKWNGSSWVFDTSSYLTTAITSLNGLTGTTQTFVNDTNVTMVSSGTTHTITWSGTLADSRITSASTWNSKIGGSGTTNELAYFTASGTIGSLTTATYPSLTELSYVKGVTSSIQTQLNTKGTFTLPSLTSGSVLFSNGTTISQSNSNFFWDNSNVRLGIGTSASPSARLHVVGDNSTAEVIRFQNETVSTRLALYNAGTTSSNQIMLYRSRGTIAAPTILSSGDVIGAIISNGYYDVGAGGYLTKASIDFTVDATPSSTNMPTAVVFQVSNSSSARAEAMRLSSAGNLLLGNTTGTDKLTVTGNINLNTAGNKIKIATGSNASIGTSGAMTAGTITISTTAVTSSSKIFLTHASVGGTVGVLSVGTITNATSFVINSSSALDTSTVNWWIIN